MRAPVLYRRDLPADHFVLAFDAPEMARDFRPGQFVMVRTAEGAFPFLSRPFSVLDIERDSAGRPRGVQLLIEVVGDGTRALSRCREGDLLDVLGPLGREFPVEPAVTDAIFVAGGIGVAPFLLLARTFREQRGKATRLRLLYGARSAANLVLLDEFKKLGVEIELATDDGTRGTKGTVMPLLDWTLPRGAASTPGAQLFACGPNVMLKAVASFAAERGVPCLASLESMMACGFGTCLACVFPVHDASDADFHYERVCTEGPVFDTRRLRFDRCTA
ncbi:MAG: dihydroorotate dehydrogenase electron transfer subunit [Planctomycetes bacterium]|nr:dihydroorotate dehydrogenase electron transfer subunit [Planctomycetota bacterium]